MAKENETIADIIAEMRSDANADEYTPDGILGQKLNYIADRLEAAHKREIEAVGNAAKLREVAEFVAHIDDNGYTSHDVQCAIEKARAAIAAPARNCDAHTADELKSKFNSELVSELPIANEHEKNLVTITANGVIDTLFATMKEGGNDGNE